MILDALILHLQRLSTEDGPGLRTTVFFKGCPLHCAWCHNPESLSPSPQVQWLENRCLNCGTCLPACPDGCLVKTSRGVVIDRSRCTGCGACVEACPAGAMELLGTRIGLEALVAEVLKDRSYFETSGGGVTVSGGEPTMQAEFVAAFLRRLREAGVRTALDTCGLCAPAALETLLPHADVILFDLKEIDALRHRALTGHDNRRILDNLLLVRDFVAARSSGPALWIRTPLIPTADGRRTTDDERRMTAGTATRETVTGIGRFLAEQMNGTVARWELCAFNNLCRDKYRRLGLTWEYAATPLLTADEVEELAACARSSGVNPKVVVATGATRRE
ncbi:MAG: glycyl-radical enzyme activating protein [Chloroflexi bacterium]|nr:glycyl-radical enzyme activating protein [Chloroflexota bacterium]